MSDGKLLGTWMLDPDDKEGLRRFGKTTMEFKDDGSLTYRITTDEGKLQLMHLTYHVEGDTLITNQPSHPREDRTSFEVREDGRLRLTHGGTTVTYRRSSPTSEKEKSWKTSKRT